MKKMIALLLAAMMVLSMAACASKTAETAAPADTAEPAAAGTAAAADSDLAYIQDKGTLVIGITDFEPMDYKDADGSWIGFDADMAKAFAESLGVTAEFVEIDWDNKILELDSKTIDCVWNGMTLTAEVTSAMECSNAYCNNAQVVIVPADKASEYQTVESVKDLTFAAEAGSAGEAELTALGYTVTPVKAQSDALMEVAAGTSDAAVIDSLMAAAMVGEGTGYASLTYTCGLNSEEYGVGFRKGSDLAQKLNDFFMASYADGSMSSWSPLGFLRPYLKKLPKDGKLTWGQKTQLWFAGDFRPIRLIVRFVIWVVRGTPLMLQLLVFYYFPGLVLHKNIWGSGEAGRFLASSIAFIFNYACYFSEIFRGGIQGVPKGQQEAGQVLGMTSTQIFFKVTLLQMVKRIVPPMSNEVITLVKDTSLSRIIALQEIIWAGQAFLKGTQGISGAIWPLFFTGIYYLIFSGLLTLALGKLEKKLDYFKA